MASARQNNLASDLFGRATPERPSQPERASQVGGGRMGWTHDRAAELHKQSPTRQPGSQPGSENWHAHQLELASFGVFAGSTAYGSALERLSPGPSKLERAGERDTSQDMLPERRKSLSLETSSLMRSTIAPGGVTDDERARVTLKATPMPSEGEPAGLTWVRVDGLAKLGPDAALNSLVFQIRNESLSVNQLMAWRAPVDPITGKGKGYCLLAFAAGGYADVTDLAHELRLRGFTVAPLSDVQMNAAMQ
mmetsp:Transcript_31223/g.78079  ORF Transcript_31223/g.78079 Transcript_31223/m.78079 type:complete len:250 (-) Transcript_31223:102-851(-)